MVFGHMIEDVFCLVLFNYFVSNWRPHKLDRKYLAAKWLCRFWEEDAEDQASMNFSNMW